MTSRSVKFEISLEKLSVKFEGDVQIAERLQSEITSALNTLSSTQNRMLSAGAQPAPTPVSAEVSQTKRRKRRRKSAEGIDTSVLDADTVSDGNSSADTEVNEGARQRRPAGILTSELTGLKTEGYFGTKRTIGAICGALAEKGHSYKSSAISPTLIQLTQRRVLKREKSPQNQWVYYAD